MKIRSIKEPELALTRRVYITEECYKLLRKEKIQQRKSMARIVCDLIINNFKKYV